MLELRHAADRGQADHGWLHAQHSFSFADYFDPRQIGFSDLRVINEDRIQAGMGFGTHPHRDMEIFTYVLDGALQHKDSMGNGSVIRPGDVQMMSAGSGITHSEFNPSSTEAAHLLQIWIVPNQRGITPRYQQAHFSEAEKRGRFRPIITPDGTNGALSIHQDAHVYAGLFDGDETALLILPEERYAYVQIARGSVELNGVRLAAGDGVRIREERELRFAKGEDSEVLVFDLRARERPALPG